VSHSQFFFKQRREIKGEEKKEKLKHFLVGRC
jgi:hypothetical protein